MVVPLLERRPDMEKAKWVLVLSVSIAIAVLLVAGCGDEGGTGTKYTPPDIPPLSTFVMDFSYFVPERQVEPLGGSDRVPGSYTKHNWTWASGNVLVWNTLITVGLAVPVLSFMEAFNHEPTRQPGGTWVWDYNFVAHQVVHLAELHGRIVDEEVQWEMYISKESEYSDFLWYSGLSNLDGTQGTWTLYTSPADPTPLLGIEWHRDPETNTGDIKYTNIVPDGPENGGYIFYGTTDGDTYNAFYDIYNKGQNNHTDIEWDRTTMVGRVKDPNHFGDADWHCWDIYHNDVDCTTSR
jgi:hypothetical protein